MSDEGQLVIAEDDKPILTNGSLFNSEIYEIKHEIVDLDSLEERESPSIVAPVPEVKTSPVLTTTHEVNNCNCSVEELVREPYSERNFIRTLEIIRKGRPTPCAKGLNDNSRLFKEVYYHKTEWLTGCSFMNKLYCWPCLIFDKVESLWNRKGFDDTGNMYKAFKRHENTQSHIVASMQLVAFVLNHCDRSKCFDEDLNALIRLNRDVMVRVVETVCVAGLGNCKGMRTHALLRLARRENCFLTTFPELHLATVKAVNVAFTESLVVTVNNSPFVSLILDEVGSRLAAVLRYSNTKGEICETFVGFFDETNISKAVNQLWKTYCLNKRLVALILGATSKIETAPDDPKLTVLHSPAHRMSYVLPFAFYHIKECVSFFHIVRCFETWLSDSQIEEAIKSRLPHSNLAKWKEHPVSALYEQKELIQDIIFSMLNKPVSWQFSSYSASLALQHALKDMEFSFLLRVFKELFPVADALLDMIITNSSNMKLCAETVDDYLKVLNWKKEKFTEIWDYIQEVDLDGPVPKKPRHVGTSKLITYYRTLYESIVDIVVTQVKMRFGTIVSLEFAELMDMKNCNQFSPSEKHLVMLKSKRDNFELSRLRNELIVAYAQVDFKGLQCEQLLRHLNETGLGEPLKQVTLLARLLLMYPFASKSQNEASSRLFSRIHKFGQKILMDPAFLQWSFISLEYNLINKLALTTYFPLNVVDVFAMEHPELTLLENQPALNINLQNKT